MNANQLREGVISRSFLIIPVSAVIITALCIYKMTRTYPEQKITGNREVKQLAPVFILTSERKDPELIHLRGYLGRHQVLLAFFDGRQGADKSPLIGKLKEKFDLLDKEGYYVFGISEAIPQENRKVIAESGGIPFNLLSDPRYEVIRQWGCYDETKQATTEKLFLIDRGGFVKWEGKYPVAIEDPDNFLDSL